MFNEQFWITAAFFVFLGFSLKFIKTLIFSALDKKIQLVDNAINDVIKAKQKSHDILITLKAEYENTKQQYQSVLEQVRTEANMIISDTEEKITLLNQKSEEVFIEYKAHAENKMIESLKNEVLITVLSMIEAEVVQNPSEQIKALEVSKNLLKKIWH